MNDMKQAPSSTSTASSLPLWQRMALLGLAALLVSFVYHAVFLRVFSHWWFEDDPAQFAFVKHVSNPVAFFTNLDVIHRFGGGAAVAPMQALSEWVDSQLAYRSVKFALWHNIVSLAATLVLLFYGLRRFAFTTAGTLALTGLWLCLPATIAVNEFLSTRHYLEGLAASLIAIILAQALVAGNWREDWKSVGLLSLAVIHASLYKEVYATALPIFLCFYLYGSRRKYAAAANLVVLGLFLAYRYWAFGANVHWDAPFLGPADYLKFLSRLPYIFAGNAGGYFLFVLFLLVLFAGYRRQQISATIIGVVVLLLMVELAVIYPISRNYLVYQGWTRRGPWDRGVLAFNTTFLFAGGYLIMKTFSRSGRVLAVLLAVVVLIPSAWHAQQVWHEAMIRHRKQGKFYLEHPDRLLFCDLQAPWFLDALRAMYEVPIRHHVAAKGPDPMSCREMETYPTIWRYVGGTFVEDPALYTKLLENTSTQPK